MRRRLVVVVLSLGVARVLGCSPFGGDPAPPPHVDDASAAAADDAQTPVEASATDSSTEDAAETCSELVEHFDSEGSTWPAVVTANGSVTKRDGEGTKYARFSTSAEGAIAKWGRSLEQSCPLRFDALISVTEDLEATIVSFGMQDEREIRLVVDDDVLHVQVAPPLWNAVSRTIPLGAWVRVRLTYDHQTGRVSLTVDDAQASSATLDAPSPITTVSFGIISTASPGNVDFDDLRIDY